MKHEPIMEFENIQQAYACLKEWQERLFLHDWIISIELDCELESSAAAEITKNHISKVAKIKIGRQDGIDDLFDNLKYCAEQIVVHELLHLIFDMCNYTKTIEEREFDDLVHTRIDFMARSLIMAKYDLSADWFSNAKGGL